MNQNHPTDPADLTLKTHGKSFHWARHLLDLEHAQRATRLYSFCREVDDIADESNTSGEAIQRLSDIEECLKRGQSKDPWLVDAMRLFRQCNIPLWIPLELIHGVKSDLKTVLVEDDAELIRYAFRVAGTVGLMMSHILDVKDSRAYPHAIDLGIAMQLTNIARDVRKDAEMGRRYLPGTSVHKVTPEQLIQPSKDLQPLVTQAVKDLLHLADHYYQSGLNGIPYLPKKARIAILVAAKVYQAIGEELNNRNFNYWDHRAHVSTQKKSAITAKTLISPIGSNPFWFKGLHHDRKLHQALSEFPIYELKAC